MYNQLKAEFYKLFHSVYLYIAAAFELIIGAAASIKMYRVYGINDIYYPFSDSLPDVSVIFITALLVARFIGKDFTDRTLHHEIAGGYSRFSVIISRFIPVAAASVVLHLIFVAAETFTIGIQAGFDFSVFSVKDLVWMFVVIIQLITLTFVFGLISFMSGGLMIGTTVTIIFDFIFCNMMRNFIRTNKIYTFSCLCFAGNNSTETLIGCTVYSLILIPVIISLTYLVFRKKEL